MRVLCRLARCLRWRYLAACCLSTAIALLLLVGAPPPTPVFASQLRTFYQVTDAAEDNASTANSSALPFSAKNLTSVGNVLQNTSSDDASKSLTPAPPSLPTPKPVTTVQVVLNGSKGVPTPPKIASPANSTAPTTTSTSTTSAPTTTPPLVVGEVFKSSSRHPNASIPLIYAVTPTYKRMEQMAELTRLSQTLMHIPRLHWIVVEDATQFSASVRQLLRRSGLNFTHMLGPKPAKYNRTPPPPPAKGPKKKGPPPIPRGVSNRLAALRWVKENVKEGVLYFADDDNTYDIRLFEEMRGTKKVSMWPVGLVTQFAVSSPVIKNGKVVGFYDGWIAGRKFPVDMAGFAVNIAFLLQKPNVTMPFVVGYEEDGFLKSLQITMKDIEPKAKNCTEVLVWHTKTVKNNPPKKMLRKDVDKYRSTNIMELWKIIS